MSCSSLDWSHKSLSPAYKCCRLICLIKVEAPRSIQTSLSLNYGYDSLLKVVLCVCLQAVKSYGCGFRVRIWPSDDLASQSFRDCFSQIRSSSIPLDWKVSKMQIMCFQPSTASNICARRVDPHRPVFATIITWKKNLMFEIMQRKLREHRTYVFFIPLCPALAENRQAE